MPLGHFYPVEEAIKAAFTATVAPALSSTTF
jgi:hypothetical protein